jgi:anti-anti-sigma factor
MTPKVSGAAPGSMPSLRRPFHSAADQDDRPSLTIRTLSSNQAMVLVLAGNIDQDTAPILHHALESAAVISPRLLVVDLSAVRLLACAGLSVLVAAHQRAEDRTCLRLVAGGRATRRPLALIGMDKCLSVFETREEALIAPLRSGEEAGPGLAG